MDSKKLLDALPDTEAGREIRDLLTREVPNPFTPEQVARVRTLAEGYGEDMRAMLKLLDETEPEKE